MSSNLMHESPIHLQGTDEQLQQQLGSASSSTVPRILGYHNIPDNLDGIGDERDNKLVSLAIANNELQKRVTELESHLKVKNLS